MTTPASVRVFACGMTESGKGHWLRALFLSRFPRILTLDPLGEVGANGLVSGGRVYRASTLPELRQALSLAVRNGRRWHVVATIQPNDFPELCRMLVPPVIVDGKCFPLLVGGMAIDMQELDLIAPSNPVPEVRGLWSRSRHVGLSIAGATQRPHGVSPIIRSQSRFHLICRQDEPADMKYLAEYLPAEAAAELPRLPWHWCLVYDKRIGAWWLLDAGGKVVRRGAPPAITGGSDNGPD